MLVRIVKMTFEPKNIKTFLSNFENSKMKIRNFEGCNLLELYRDKNCTNVFFTYSYWKSESDLLNYKNSSLFKSLWSQTKVLFSEKPEAWSVNKLTSLT